MQPIKNSSVVDIKENANQTSILTSLLDSAIIAESGGTPIDRHNQQLKPIQIITKKKDIVDTEINPNLVITELTNETLKSNEATIKNMELEK
jgi:hypothetical protein